jgi:HSP20 family molecular chaperone IbpA
MAGGLTRGDPLAEITQLRSRFDRLLDELGGQDHGAWMPAIDLVRHDDDLVVRVDLPGIKSRMVRVARSSPTRRLAAVVGVAAPPS